MAAALAPPAAPPPPESRPLHERLETAELGMWVFLATEVLFFGGIFAAYGYGRQLHPEGWMLAGRHTDIVLGTINTGLLLTSSCAVAVAVAAAGHGRGRWVARLLWVTAAIGIAFIAIKGLEWSHEWQ